MSSARSPRPRRSRRRSMRRARASARGATRSSPSARRSSPDSSRRWRRRKPSSARSCRGRWAGRPAGVFQYLHLSHDDTEGMIESPEVDFVAFTGSVEGGHAVQRAAAERFIGTGLELGGKDPAYVRPDADLAHAVENLVDGAFFNSGQSCCGIERIYVDEKLFRPFVDGFVEL